MNCHPASLPTKIDIAIIGGGPVGAFTALRLAQSGHQVVLIEARKTPASDPRTLALSWSNVKLLEEIKVWHSSLAVNPIHSVHVSQKDSLGRTLIQANEYDLPALGYVVEYFKLMQHMYAQLEDSPIHCLFGIPLREIKVLENQCQLMIEVEGTLSTLHASLVIFADGGGQVTGLNSEYFVKDYAQSALLSTLTLTEPHQNIAYERFTQDGPLALLPYGDQFALIWSQPTEKMQLLLDSEEELFLQTVQQQFNYRLPPLTTLGPRYHFPLFMKRLKSSLSSRVICIGNAAQTLHPIAGQGLNLGLRDAVTLARLLEYTPQNELAHPQTIKRYSALRHKDKALMLGFTNLLAEGFAKNWPLLKPLRSLGLLILDQQPFLKRRLAKYMLEGF